MQLRTLGTVAASFGLWLGSTPAAEPGVLSLFQRTENAVPVAEKTADQKLADAVIAKVRASSATAKTDLEFSAASGTLSVSGKVESETQKTEILEIVRRVDGVKMVKDGVQVTAAIPQILVPEAPTMVQPADNKVANQKLADAVAAKLQGTDAAANSDLEFSADSGAVSVIGTVGSGSQKKAILEIVRFVDGVKVVRDGLQVKAMTSATQPVAMAQPVTTASVSVPVENKADNQKLADSVYLKLRASDAATNADLDIFANNGEIIVAGNVGSEMQKRAIIDIVRRVVGVKIVKDGVQVKAMAPRAVPQMVMPVQAFGPLAAQAPSGMPPMAMNPGNPQIAEAYPVGPGGGLDGAAPPLPQNAWPTYAPYNNVSRVAYPTAYPYNAFPFIGPYYPFPKVPLGWRKVTLEWEDGHWWLGRKQAPIDYWRVKFGY